MFQRLYEVHEVTQETKELSTARKIAAIVAALVLPTIARSELAYSALPDALEAKLVGYLQGFCLPICAAWQVDDADVSVAATGLIVTLMFPDSPATFSASIDGLMPTVPIARTLSSLVIPKRPRPRRQTILIFWLSFSWRARKSSRYPI